MNATGVPALPPQCNSWIAEAPAGQRGYRGSRFVEVYQCADAGVLDSLGWTVRTADDHLARINTNPKAKPHE